MKPGDVVVVRVGAHGALPLWLIEATDEQVVGYLAAGTEVAYPMLADGRGLREVPVEERWSHPRQAVRRPWERSDVVMIIPRDRRHSLWVFHENGRHVGWYVNLEAAHDFGDRTITTRDEILDIWVPVETGEPQWKDEDEFEAAQRVGRLTPEYAAELRAEGERVIAERPWPTGWEGWRPPANWSPPELPDGWDDSSA
jgi:hypothetical protein